APARRGCGGDVHRHHVPGAWHGRRRRAGRERRPGDSAAGAERRGRRATPRPGSGGVCADDPRSGPARACRAARRPSRDRVLRRPLHGRRLPGRRQAEPRVRDRQGADVPRWGDVACADAEAGGHVRALRRREGARRRRRDPGVRLVGRGALAVRLRGVRGTVFGARLGRGRCSDDPFRHRHGDALAGDGGGRRRRDRPRLAHPAGSRLGRGRRGPRRAGQPRSGRSARAVGANRDRDARYSRPCRRAAGSCIQPWARSATRNRPGRSPAADGVRARGDRRSARMSAAIVLMAYGSPERLADVPEYYADIRGGRPIPPEHLEDLVERYRRLGIEAESPLNAITEQTRSALESELGLPVFTGLKHWTPRIAEAADHAVARGVEAVVGLGLAPHYSELSIAGYREQLEAALADRVELLFIDSWHDEEGFIDLLADRVRATDA